jgi:hypothetical protein
MDEFSSGMRGEGELCSGDMVPAPLKLSVFTLFITPLLPVEILLYRNFFPKEAGILDFPGGGTPHGFPPFPQGFSTGNRNFPALRSPGSPFLPPVMATGSSPSPPHFQWSIENSLPEPVFSWKIAGCFFLSYHIKTDRNEPEE